MIDAASLVAALVGFGLHLGAALALARRRSPLIAASAFSVPSMVATVGALGLVAADYPLWLKTGGVGFLAGGLSVCASAGLSLLTGAADHDSYSSGRR